MDQILQSLYTQVTGSFCQHEADGIHKIGFPCNIQSFSNQKRHFSQCQCKIPFSKLGSFIGQESQVFDVYEKTKYSKTLFHKVLIYNVLHRKLFGKPMFIDDTISLYRQITPRTISNHVILNASLSAVKRTRAFSTIVI